jgi:hypothetical protein
MMKRAGHTAGGLRHGDMQSAAKKQILIIYG